MKRGKIDPTKNGEVLPERKTQRLYQLRIDAHTVILVPKERCNEDYAKEYRIRHGWYEDCARQKGQPMLEIGRGELTTLRENGYSIKEMAKHFNCSVRTIARRLKEFGLIES